MHLDETQDDFVPGEGGGIIFLVGKSLRKNFFVFHRPSAFAHLLIFPPIFCYFEAEQRWGKLFNGVNLGKRATRKASVFLETKKVIFKLGQCPGASFLLFSSEYIACMYAGNSQRIQISVEYISCYTVKAGQYLIFYGDLKSERLSRHWDSNS